MNAATLSIRLRRDQLNTIKKAAKTEAIPLSLFVRQTMVRRARQVLKKRP
jgi:uncharacterized protein (DUF1778 family)